MNLSETAFVTPKDGNFVSGFASICRFIIDEYKERKIINLAASCFNLKWFTPTDEVSLCGHATLATSKVLFDILGTLYNIYNINNIFCTILSTKIIFMTILGNKNESIQFDSLSGPLHCKKLADGKFQLDFPGYEISSIVKQFKTTFSID